MRGDTTTEDLRQAMKHYEALFENLISDVGDDGEHWPVTRPANTR